MLRHRGGAAPAAGSRQIQAVGVVEADEMLLDTVLTLGLFSLRDDAAAAALTISSSTSSLDSMLRAGVSTVLSVGFGRADAMETTPSEEHAPAVAVFSLAPARWCAWPPLLCLQVGLALLVSTAGLGWVGIDFSLFAGGQ